jgi:hypothetical protein
MKQAELSVYNAWYSSIRHSWPDNLIIHQNIIEPKNFFVMGNLLYIIAVILIIGWILGFFVYSAGGLIHILLVIAIIAILFRVISGNRV